MRKQHEEFFALSIDFIGNCLALLCPIDSFEFFQLSTIIRQFAELPQLFLSLFLPLCLSLSLLFQLL